MNFKIIKKNYNDELEEVLSKKSYDEDVKNLLLDILYKIENAYDDYETVKVNAKSGEEYKQNIIDIIENYCDSIVFMTQNNENKTFYIDKEKKEIRCYPIERKLLYALSKIQKKDDIIKSDEKLLNRALTNLLNVGNNINMVEPLRDFNGFSWNISILEIENLYYNLIYQDLIFLIGNDFLEEWINKPTSIVDYLALFEEELEKKYGHKITKNIISLLKKLSILLEISIEPKIKDELLARSVIVKQQIEDMKDKKSYLERISREKIKLEKEIRRYDILINDKKLLQEEYENRNERLSLNEKIFSIRVLSSKLKEERNELLKKINKFNVLINPKNFRGFYDKLLEENEYLEDSQAERLEDKILENLLSLQKEVLRSFKTKITKCKNRSEFIKIIYEFRYFYLIPFTIDENVDMVKKLSRLKNIVIKEIIKKANELNILNKVFKDDKKEIEIIRKIFSLKIISLEDIYYKIFESNGIFYIQFFDEDIVDERFIINLELEKEDFKVKLGKKVKLFI